MKSGDYYIVDEAETSLLVTQFALLSQANLFVKDKTIEGSGMIQATDQMQLDFFLPVTLNAGCQIKITLPSQYSLDTITEVWTLQAFGMYT